MEMDWEPVSPRAADPRQLVSICETRPSPYLSPLTSPSPTSQRSRLRASTIQTDITGPEPSTPLHEPNRAITDDSISDRSETPNRKPGIRLIKIFSSKSCIKHYEMIFTDLHNHPSYKAISYAWGDPSDTQKIHVKQGSRESGMRVPTSLSAALEALRDDTKDILVWADSMCINQRSNRDKTQQLPHIPEIYSKAEQVVVWLGVEKDDSEQAQKLLHGLVNGEVQLSPLLDLGPVVSLFDREYWSRLWVVQEVLHAKEIVVLCGSSRLPWDCYVRASRIFQSPESVDKIRFFNERSGHTRLITSQHRLNPSQILVHHGPASILHIQRALELAREPFGLGDFHYTLHLMRLSRTKLATDPKDRVYGILGVLPRGLRPEVRVDYSLTVKEIYIDFMEWWMKASRSLNIICDSIHFPPQISSANLPSWVPNWSYDPTTQSLASLPMNFAASRGFCSEYRFPERENGRGSGLRNKLAIAGVRIGEISDHGTAVNTYCRAADYCMTFLQWRALLLQHFDIDPGSETDSEERRRRVMLCEHQRKFCQTLSLGQPRETNRDAPLIEIEKAWVKKCYSVFATVIKARLPRLPIDEDLMAFKDACDDIKPDATRQFLQDNFAEYMMGRCFCIVSPKGTNSKSLGLGSGAMARGDVVVVPYGCSTPVLLRPEGFSAPDKNGQRTQEYRFVGDACIDGYMHGEAMHNGSKEEFILH